MKVFQLEPILSFSFKIFNIVFKHQSFII